MFEFKVYNTNLLIYIFKHTSVPVFTEMTRCHSYSVNYK